jgi:hypothetical protein
MRTLLKFVSVMLVVVILSGCFGNFQLTRNLYKWNSSVGDKFVNTAVMWVMMIVPVYGVCGFIDMFILNLVEFWSGENPLTMKSGDVDIQIVENEGKIYQIKASQNRFDITQLEGEDAGKSVAIIFDPSDGSWYLQSEEITEKIAGVENGYLTLNYPDGSQFSTGLEVR